MNMKRLLAMALALTLALLSVSALAEEANDPIVATAFAGDVTVTKSEVADTFETALNYYLDYYAQNGYAMDEYDTEFQAAVAQEVVQVKLSEKIINYYADKQGYVLTDEARERIAGEVNATLDSAREYYETYLGYYGYTGEELESIVSEELAAGGYDFDAMYATALVDDKYFYLEDLATAGVAVTDEEVKAAFDAKVETAKTTYDESADAFINDYINEADPLYTPEGMRLIYSIYFAPAEETAEPVVEEETIAEETAEATAEPVAEATEEAAGIDALQGEEKAAAVLDLIKNGADFVETMIAYNEDTSTEEQLLAGYPVSEASELYSPDFKAAAMAIEAVGDVSEVVATDYGCFILYYAKDLTAGAVTFEDRKALETENALTEKKADVFQTYLSDVLTDADVQLLDASSLFRVYSAEVIEAQIAYASVSADTQLTDMPFGDAVAELKAGASLYILGRIGVDGEEFAFVSVPNTEFKGFVNTAAMTDIEEETALAADNAALTAAAPALDKKPTFTIAMNDGSVIYGELYPETAPQSVGNFVSLANAGFYNGLIFHRVIPGFMIQGGDPAGNGTGGPGYAIKGEFESNGVENALSHVRGVLSMARSSAPDSAGSQFFIMHADNDYLDGDYAAFGMVLGGIESVDLIASAETDSSDKPRTEQTMREVFVQTYGKTYEFTKLSD